MTKRDVLQSLKFGERVAEEESQELERYFVETDQWKSIFAGDIDVIYGAKGSGKSALYALLLARAEQLRERGVLTITAENPRGALAFKGVVDDPPTNEREMVRIWELYILSLVGQLLQEHAATSDHARPVIAALSQAGLLKQSRTLSSLLTSVVSYVRGLLKAESIEGGLKLDPHSGLPVGLTGKITFREPTDEETKQGLVSVTSLFKESDRCLRQLDVSAWVLLDRLDVAFAEVKELEQNALRALFKVYLDLLGFKNIRLKIFLRTDVWSRITKAGFREASHVTRHTSIIWDNTSLLNLVVRRALQNDAIVAFYGINPDNVLVSTNAQKNLFYEMFPRQVEVGPNKPETFEWLLGRTKDGSGTTAPRELIHLLNSARSTQLRSIEIGDAEPDGEQLFERTSIKDALPEVSKVRLEQTIYAEYPALRRFLEALTEEKTLQTSDTLQRIWNIPKEESARVASELVEIGFFERRGPKDAPQYWVPFLYRDALRMTQGTAE
jgi:hypothetical protein